MNSRFPERFLQYDYADHDSPKLGKILAGIATAATHVEYSHAIPGSDRTIELSFDTGPVSSCSTSFFGLPESSSRGNGV